MDSKIPPRPAKNLALPLYGESSQEVQMGPEPLIAGASIMTSLPAELQWRSCVHVKTPSDAFGAAGT